MLSDALYNYPAEHSRWNGELREIMSPLMQWMELAKDVVEERWREVIVTLTQQIDNASSAYVGYLCLLLFFLSPLVIFWSGIFPSWKRYVFGAQKHVFILVVLVVWWGVRYFRSFSVSIELQLYMKNLLKDPCYVDASFLWEAGQTLDRMCHELGYLENEWTNKSAFIDSTLKEVGAFQEMCHYGYPCQYLCGILPQMNDTATKMDLESIHFGTVVDQDDMCPACDSVDVHIQRPNATFLGNTTLCHGPKFAKQAFLGMAPDTYIDGWNLWIYSGLLASILVKTCVANFGMSLLHMADPLFVCNGEFEGLPCDQQFSSTDE
eukprot:CAMPEP_0172485240 /NCGR_PEP_ID=MMETSP1066-20121228/13184_1 /TAXON_ID=671091 /ORGANISM="Coscinodiscus wailesii, Strain CCMP2513" /LENGTH=320 /DNA_ID=CAMNT_0013250357 /DNA_START=177 /DNA_END=1139 /DNA_ORIENTATION=-